MKYLPRMIKSIFDAQFITDNRNLHNESDEIDGI